MGRSDGVVFILGPSPRARSVASLHSSLETAWGSVCAVTNVSPDVLRETLPRSPGVLGLTGNHRINNCTARPGTSIEACLRHQVLNIDIAGAHSLLSAPRWPTPCHRRRHRPRSHPQDPRSASITDKTFTSGNTSPPMRKHPLSFPSSRCFSGSLHEYRVSRHRQCQRRAHDGVDGHTNINE